MKQKVLREKGGKKRKRKGDRCKHFIENMPLKSQKWNGKTRHDVPRAECPRKMR